MPALCSWGQHEALHAAAGELHAEDHLFAFLDDVYLVTRRDRVCQAIQDVTSKIHQMAGVQTHLGKLEVWSADGGPPPPGLEALSSTAWKGNLPEHLNGLVVLGAPLGYAPAQLHGTRTHPPAQAFTIKLPRGALHCTSTKGAGSA